MKLTTAQEATLRKRPHKTRLWLSIYQPQTIFACQVTGTNQFGETSIPYYGSVSGSAAVTYPNMTVLIGTNYGQDDVGRIRLRSATGTSLLFAENNVIWSNGQYLTFIDYINVEAIFPRIIKDPGNDENVIFYKDDDIAYSNQNSIYGTFPNAGSHRAAFIETGSVSLYWTATGTYNVREDSITYDWHFEGGTPTGSTALTPGNVAYVTPGHYKTTLTVTSASGAVDKTYRYVSIYDRPENGTNTPILKWKLNDFSGSRNEGGWRANIRVWQSLGSIEPNALVVLFADDWYGDTYQSLGGNGQNNSKIVFAGYILKDSIQFNYREGWAEFDIGSITDVMKESEGFSVSCQSKAVPSTWFQLQEMTVQKALYHYFRWHSTVLNIADFQYTGDDRLVQYFDTDRASLYDAINSFVTEGVYGEVVTDRQGKIWAEISPIGYEDPIDSIQSGMTLQKHDWVGEPNISQRRTAEVSFVEMGGIKYEGANTDGFQALLSNAPSSTPLYRGKSDSPRQGLILTGQTQLNKISGNYLANRNSKFEDVSLNLAGNYRNLDIAPQERLYLLVDQNDTTIGESLIGYPFRLVSMDWQYNSEKESFYPDVSFEQIATGTAGETIIIPPIPPDGGYAYPPLELPPFPSFPSTPAVQQSSTTVLGVESTRGLFYTTDFDSEYPTWFVWNTGIQGTDAQYMHNFPGGGSGEPGVFITPSGAVYVAIHGVTGGLNSNWGKIYRAPYIGGTFSLIIDSTFLNAIYPGQIGGIRGFGFNPEKSEEVAFITSYDVGFGTPLAHNMFIGNYAGFEKKATFSVQSSYAGNITFGNNEWVWDKMHATQENLVQFNANGDYLGTGDNMGQGTSKFHRRAGDTKILIKKIGTANIFARSEDNGRTFASIDLSPKTIGTHYDISPNGYWLMADWDFGVSYKGRSADGGYSWTALSGLVPGGDYEYRYCGGEGTLSKWIAGRGAIYFTDNFGNSWVQRTGNLLEIFPPPSGATIVKFVAYLEVEE